MRTALITIGLLVLGSSTADACQRCGLFGRLCRMQQPVVVKQQAYVAPVKQYVAPAQVAYVPAPVYQPPSLYVVNNYPPSNGVAGIIAQQGATGYGNSVGVSYQSAALAYQNNYREFIQQANQLQQAMVGSLNLAVKAHTDASQTQLALESSLLLPLARGQAAAQVLEAAGLSNNSPQSSTTTVLKITGNRIESYTLPAENQQQPGVNEHTKPGELPPPAPVPNSVIAAKCAECHGLDLSEPKHGLYLDSGHKLDAETIVNSLDQIRLGKMPKNGSLTADEKGRIFEELLSLQKPRETQ